MTPPATTTAAAADPVAEIRQRADAAIPGPWAWFGNTETNDVHLATCDRGRLWILSTGVEETDWVADREDFESMPAVEAVPYAGERSIDELEERGEARRDGQQIVFLSEDPRTGDEVETHREPYIELRDRLGREALATDPRYETSVHRNAILRFVGPSDDERRAQAGGVLECHKRHVRYEALGGQTRAEAGLADNTGRGEAGLYREDFCGIATPEAEFIAHARQDVDTLLGIVAALQAREQAVRDALARQQQLSDPDSASQQALDAVQRALDAPAPDRR